MARIVPPPSGPSTPVPPNQNSWLDRVNPLWVIVIALLLLIAGIVAWIATENGASGGTGSINAPPAKVTYVVQKGDFLVKIGGQLNVPWEAIFLENEIALGERARERCGKLSDRYTQSAKRKGHYCNELLTFNGKPMVAPNSLQPGDVLVIPNVTTAPAAVSQAVGAIAGDEIVIVIDDSGSMSDERQMVSSWYMGEIKRSGKKVTKVILYADGYVRELDPQGGLNLDTTGSVENTRSALETAARHRPDAIVLVSDEPGDDWDGFRGLKLPPVVAHSLEASADANLAEVARLTGGTFLKGSAAAIARR